MTRFDHVMRTAAVYAVTLFLIAPAGGAGQGAGIGAARSERRKEGASPRLAGEHQRAGNDEPCAQTTRSTSSITRPCKFQSRSRAQSP
jgi:hypothetical protein